MQDLAKGYISLYCHLCGQLFQKWCTLKNVFIEIIITKQVHKCILTGSGDLADDDETTGQSDDFTTSMHTMMPDVTEASIGIKYGKKVISSSGYH